MFLFIFDGALFLFRGKLKITNFCRENFDDFEDQDLFDFYTLELKEIPKRNDEMFVEVFLKTRNKNNKESSRENVGEVLMLSCQFVIGTF